MLTIREAIAAYLLEKHNVTNFDMGLGAHGYWHVWYGRVNMYIKLKDRQVVDVQVD